jgi:flagellar biosynthesis protein FlhF
MEAQTFRAATMLQALQEVQKELGSDAIVVSMREQPASVWRKACCEIVATRPAAKPIKATPAAPAKVAVPAAKIYLQQSSAPVRESSMPAPSAPAPAGKTAVPFTPRSLTSPAAASEVAPKKVTGWVAPVVDARPAPVVEETLPAAPAKLERLDPADIKGQAEVVLPLDKLSQKLLKQGLNESLVERLVRTCKNALPAFRLEDEAYLAGYMKKLLLAALKPAAQHLSQGRRVVCLVGMGGAGKTSLAAKLAADFGLQQGKRVAWIEANTVRTGAIAEARSITDSFGVELHLAYTPADLTEALEKTSDADLVIIDTPACNPRREASLVDLGALLTSVPGRITYLVAPATTKEADLTQALAAFGPFYLDGLVFTKMDETTTFGSVYNLGWQSKLPVAYFTEGPGVMEGLVAGNNQVLVDALFGGASHG